MKKKILAGVFSFFAFQSMAWASPCDSICTVTKNYKVYVLHQIDYNQSLESIASRYRTTVSKIKSENPNLAFKSGDKIYVPYSYKAKPSNTNNSQNPTVISTMHKVKDKETVYSISKAYGMTMTRFRTINHMSDNKLSVGDFVYVEKKVKSTTSQITKADEHAYRNFLPAVPARHSRQINIHEVKSGEYPGLICKHYDIKLADFFELNHMNKQSRLKIGQKVIMGYKDSPIESNEKATITENVLNKDNVNLANGKVEKGVTKPSVHHVTREEKAVACIRINNDESVKKMALHAKAPIGSYLRITSINTKKIIVVKVVGRLSEKDINNGVGLKLSNAACLELNEPDNKFSVRVKYSK